MRIASVLCVLIAFAACSSGTVPATKGCEATVHVFLQTDVSKVRERHIGRAIDAAPRVVDRTFYTREEVYREFKKLDKKQSDVYESKQRSDFPSRYEVTLASTQEIDEFVRHLAGTTTGVDRIVPGGCASESPK